VDEADAELERLAWEELAAAGFEAAVWVSQRETGGAR
jgi:hypothetical protein